MTISTSWATSTASGENIVRQQINRSMDQERETKGRKTSREIVLEEQEDDEEVTSSSSGHITTSGTAPSSNGIIIQTSSVNITSVPHDKRNSNSIKMSSSSRAPQRRNELKDFDASNLVDSLIREYLSRQNMKDIKEIFEQERPRASDSLTSTSSILESLGLEKQHKRNKITENKNYKSVLETFVDTWLEEAHQATFQDQESRSSSNASIVTESADTKKKSKPKLSVVIADQKPQVVVATQSTGYENEDFETFDPSTDVFATIGNPGHTPKPRPSEALDLGKPGSTPRARPDSLALHGIEDVPEPEIPLENLVIGLKIQGGEKNKPKKKRDRHVTIGEPGSTPRKEYIFFKTTPPSFVTETVEDAVSVHEKLANDPSYNQRDEATRFVELNSSDVGKYKVGQMVYNLGSGKSVSGAIFKKLGSKQCGESGPGTIVIDTFQTSPINVEDNRQEVQPENVVDLGSTSPSSVLAPQMAQAAQPESLSPTNPVPPAILSPSAAPLLQKRNSLTPISSPNTTAVSKLIGKMVDDSRKEVQSETLTN